MAADYAVAAHETQVGVEHVHRTASAVRGSSFLAEQLGHHCFGIDAPSDRVPVLAVAGEDVVVLLQRENASHDSGLLADVEVAVAADLGLRVLLLGALLEAADELHLPVQAEQEVAILLLELERLRGDRAGCGGWGGGFDRGCHFLLSILLDVRGLGRRGRRRAAVGDVNRPSLRGQRGLHQGFGQGRVRVNRAVELLHGQTVLHRERGLGDQIGGTRSDDVRAEKLPRLGVGEDFDVALGLTKRQGAAGRGERKAADLDRDPLLLRFLLPQPDVGDLGVGVDAVRRGVVVGRSWRVTRDVLDGAHAFV